MSKLLYTLEDYFDALAETRVGRLSGRLSLRLSRLFAMVGDLSRVNTSFRR